MRALNGHVPLNQAKSRFCDDKVFRSIYGQTRDHHLIFSWVKLILDCNPNNPRPNVDHSLKPKLVLEFRYI